MPCPNHSAVQERAHLEHAFDIFQGWQGLSRLECRENLVSRFIQVCGIVACQTCAKTLVFSEANVHGYFPL